MSDINFFAMDFNEGKHLAFAVEKEAPMIVPPVLNVYLAGPLTNNDKCVDCLCREVREIVKRLLGSYEYNGVRFHVYDPGDITSPGTAHTPEEVYELDHERTMTADLVVFHVNAPSLGVGCECQIAADTCSPKVVIARNGTPLSRMFTGVHSETLATIEYEQPRDVEMQLSQWLPTIARRAAESAQSRRPIMQAVAESRLGRVILRQRIVNNVPLEDLAARTNIKVRWLRRVERVPELAACCTLAMLMRIADVVGCYLQLTNPGNLPVLKPSDDSLGPSDKQSLDNLVEYALGRGDGCADDRSFRLWNQYREECQEENSLLTVAHREGEHRVVTVDEWRNRDQRLGLF